MSVPELEPEPLTRFIVVPVQIMLETTDLELDHAALIEALALVVVLPAELEGGADPVTVTGYTVGTPLEVAVPPEPDAGRG